MADRSAMRARLAELKKKREQGRRDTQEQVAEEDRRAKLPKNYEARKARAEWKLEDDRKRKEAEEKGLDYDRVRAMSMTVEDAKQFSKKRSKKPNMAAERIATKAESTRQYERLTKQLKPTVSEDVATEEADELEPFKKPRKEAVDALVTDVEAQIEKKKKFRRRRAVYKHGDIDYINEKNRVYNEKLEKYYGKYSKDIKDSFERGTAL
ncbi:hypothetical protein PTSG_11337 [Salpingoeca rosetta]|uniref:Pre-mRNA-splicing factor SYF2 n=1 Tax=Salpingoeca rosetta (strain ATCC 50818 / BSB-021) TaxID=946362 RepID=F2UT41_SALR5|nr:uncharacterized protein PTSG_11337 [Salpingoeca rosetta]EGD81300.1 hypothetical protein PTSG_11337 [Salpingoeca rosetta]|eukprot:XP_004987696.1 hypothetical protein PTSG_11337 [Salpingoeca rosetta]